MDKLKQEFEELLAVRQMVETAEFQKLIMKPLYEEIDTLKSPSKCKNWDDVCKLKGKEEGLNWLIETLKQLDCDFKNKNLELKQALEASGNKNSIGQNL